MESQRRRRGVTWLLAITAALTAGTILPVGAHGAAKKAAKQPARAWTRISPPQVSTNPADFGHANFGFDAVAVSPKSGAVFVGTCYQGLWESINEGKTWVKVNTGTGGNLLDTGRVWTLAIDPSNPQVMYSTAGYGAGGVLKSTDGGKSWTQMFDGSFPAAHDLQGSHVASIEMDPTNPNHLIAAFHDIGSAQYTAAGPVAETRDGGQSWTIHTVGKGVDLGYVHFLNNSSTWLYGSFTKGLWRTTDAGASWKQVSPVGIAEGGNQMYRARNGAWYIPGSGVVQRSTNNGRTWKAVSISAAGGQFISIMGTSSRLYTAPSYGWVDPSRKAYYYVSPEKSGMHWSQYGKQSFGDGPVSMAYDSNRHILYSANWTRGVWKLQGQ